MNFLSKLPPCSLFLSWSLCARSKFGLHSVRSPGSFTLRKYSWCKIPLEAASEAVARTRQIPFFLPSYPCRTTSLQCEFLCVDGRVYREYVPGPLLRAASVFVSSNISQSISHTRNTEMKQNWDSMIYVLHTTKYFETIFGFFIRQNVH